MLTPELVRKIKRIEIRTRHLVEDTFAGDYHSRFKGRGMAFDEVRPYQVGDEVRTIDWNVTARTGSVHVKRFIEERELTVMLVVDASGSFDFGSVGRWKRDLAAEISAVLAFAATTNDDRVGLLIFTDQVELIVPPRKGRRHVLRLVRELLAFQPSGRGTDIRGALDTVNRLLHRRGIVFLVSDFALPAETYRDALRRTARRHDLVAVELQDPLEAEIPDIGLIALEDAETGSRIWIDSSDPDWRKDFRSRGDARADALRSALRDAGIDRIQAGGQEDYADALAGFFRRRARRRRR